MAAPNSITGENINYIPADTAFQGKVTMSVAVGTDLATVILELAEIRAALVTLGLIDA